MECPYLETSREKSTCSASTGCMRPCELDMTRYCKTEEHYRCPILLAHTLRRGSYKRPSWAAVA